jgi:hypothetical protein
MTVSRAFIDRQKHIAESTWGYDKPHAFIVTAHPGQEPNRDPKYNRENYAEDVSTLVRLSDSSHAPPIEELEKQLAGELAVDKPQPARRGAAASEG